MEHKSSNVSPNLYRRGTIKYSVRLCVKNGIKCTLPVRERKEVNNNNNNNLYFSVTLIGNTAQRRYRKWMIESWQECASFPKASQILTDQVMMIIMKSWIFYLEILEINQNANRDSRQQNTNTTDTRYINKQENITDINCKLIRIETSHTLVTQNKHLYKKKKI